MASLLAKPNEVTQEVIDSAPEELFLKLKPRHRLFIREYMLRADRTAAAQAAGYQGPNTRNIAGKILKLPEVIEVVKKLNQLLSERCIYDVSNAIKAQKDLLQLSIDAKQFTAAAKIKEHLDLLAGHWDPNKIEIKGLAPLSINIYGIKPPAYAQEELDVTPKKEAISGKDEPDPETK